MGISTQALTGAVQQYLGGRQQKQKTEQELMLAALKAQMQQVQQQQQMRQFQQMFGGGQGRLPINGGAGIPQRPQIPSQGMGQVQQRPAQFIPKPTISMGPSGTTMGATFVENPEIARRQQQLTTASGLRKEFNASKAFKDFETVDRSAKALEQAYKLAIRPGAQSRIASDQALGVLFQKMLDPTSVVRESEYARTPEGASLLNRLQAYWPKVRQGGLALKNEDRFAIYEMSEKLLQGAQQTFNQSIDRYTNIAGLYQIDPKLIFGGIKKINIKDIAFQQPLGNGQQGMSNEDNMVNQLLDQLGAK